MARYRLLSGRHSDADGRHEPEDVVELSDDEYAAFRDKFEPVDDEPVDATDDSDAAAADDTVSEPDDGDEAAKGSAEAPSADETGEPPVDPGAFTIDELQAHLKEADDYTAADYDALYAAESAGEDRSGATDAINAHRK